MAHTEPRSTPLREGTIAVVTGAVYGCAHTLSGHPLDNLKTSLQLDPALHGLSPLAAARRMHAAHGISAFFRGCVPPLWGSAVYRAAFMSAYEACFTWCEASLPHDSWWKRELLGGTARPLVVGSTVVAALCRSVVEAPIEQAKVMRQTGRAIEWPHLYRGLPTQTARTTSMLLCILLPYDYCRRHSRLFRSGIMGQCAVVTSCCAAAYALVWPLETLKNMVQAGLPHPSSTLRERLAYLGGPAGLYRGALPGVVCGGLRNGCAMLAMNGLANPLVTRLGLRETGGR